MNFRKKKLFVIIILASIYFVSCHQNNTSEKNQPTKVEEGSAISSNKQTHAELCYKTGGYFENSKYIDGGEFKSLNYLRVPDEGTDHSEYIKYEGPGWESDKIAYRIYLDERNAIDIFGKKVDTMVLAYVGQDGYNSYHEMADWGMDILKVGASLGIGSIAFWNGENAKRVENTDSVICSVSQDGALFSEILIDYYGWKIDTTSINLHTAISIEAGSRASKYTIRYEGKLDNLCTGIVKSEKAKLITGQINSEWNYLATWGAQSLAEDMLGMAIIYHVNDWFKTIEDPDSHVIVFKPQENTLEYYFLGAWEQETEGIKTEKDFIEYLDQFTSLLNNPE